MKYCTPAEMANVWGVSVSVVRKFCTQGRVPGAVLKNKMWYIPEDAPRPERVAQEPEGPPKVPELGAKLYHQMTGRNYHGLYDYTQINLTYSSCRMASCRVTRSQVEMIFRKGKVGGSFEPTKVSDLIEVLNHCAGVDYILRHIMDSVTQQFIKRVHQILTQSTVDQRRDRVKSGTYRTKDSGPRGRKMIPADRVSSTMTLLIREYEKLESKGLEDILNFHVRFERIFPFEDYNGRVGRLIMFKECLRHDVMPFIIDDKKRSRYLEGIKEWDTSRTKLTGLAIELQERYEEQILLQKMFARNKEFTGLIDIEEEEENEADE